MEKVKKKINLQRLSSILSEKELKNVLGGSGGSGSCTWECTIDASGTGSGVHSCSNSADCWTQAEAACSGNGIRIICP